jgi:secondary thiamine-phosphate synthase enzyme
VYEFVVYALTSLTALMIGMPAHIKSALTATSLSIPILNGKLTLGTWQGIYLWEHRRHSHHRQVVMHLSD